MEGAAFYMGEMGMKITIEEIEHDIKLFENMTEHKTYLAHDAVVNLINDLRRTLKEITEADYTRKVGNQS